jgi:phosphoglycolate phosphatase
MAKTLFLDLDGTLTDPMIGITGSIQYAMRKLGVEVPEAHDLKWCIGPPLLENFQTLVGPERAASAVVLYRERFASEGLYENTPYSGIHEALAELRSAGLTLCVASSKPHIYVNEILAHFELRAYFTAVFGSELDGTHSDKSDLLAYALAETGVSADDAIMIGDRKHDIIGALDNGIAPIGALYGYGSREELTQAGARHFAHSPSELPSLVLSPRSFRTP